MRRPCLGPATGVPCPSNALTLARRCLPCNSAWHHARNQQPERAKYKGSWPAYSRKRRAEVGYCQVQGKGCTGRPDTLDHTTGLVACLVCHRPDAQGGVYRAIKQGLDRVRL